ncbi:MULTISPECIES: DEAD/DEAH box helicase [unclassified Paenibacillus]|uniref:DEAD/DEAH box helicase n=1 Tax=unclassified Paenibacillus TaxID=185978 RepID=UPI001AE2BF94|nr:MULTISPECIES: DEAD/DEAH box helicase [unclassified Paenibacillus]MBP1156691.1 superfamily II DNA/RNA helicase [Paenibacillus sp. PvP091]MBP1172571.1 superfamily II DNA/RNA helicase [Paenibacillus sp. PvR098]MBP2438951.1 superfamily II DNA/RNA helicase [Paenibacillus sp. PvP052]
MNEQGFKDYKLSEDIIRALDSLGYQKPTEVQSRVIPFALEKKDMTVKSHTGSGKTAAYGIPICEMVEWEENRPQALILTPTRELADQVKQDIMNIGRYKRIKATAIYGKQPFARQKVQLTHKNHVVVGTPGRVMDHIEKQTIDLEQVRFLVIDEADEMLSMGFIEQVEKIIRELPKDRMTMLFSATLPKDVENLCHRYMNHPLDIEMKTEGKTTSQIEHSLYMVKDENKLNLLRDVTMVENPDSCIIFCRTQVRVDVVFKELDKRGYPCDRIHGGMEQDNRFQVMNAFKQGEFRYLIATDVAARGIDIDSISHVINYDLPLENASYVHRTGRTGRAGHSGKAISFATPNEEKFLFNIEKYIGFEIPRKSSPSKEAVTHAKAAFEAKMRNQPAVKKDRSSRLDQEILKLYFNGGKKKKIRAVDFVGTIAKIEGVSADDIGIITIEDNASYVDILNGKGRLVLHKMKDTTIKGKLLKVQEANKK